MKKERWTADLVFYLAVVAALTVAVIIHQGRTEAAPKQRTLSSRVDDLTVLVVELMHNQKLPPTVEGARLIEDLPTGWTEGKVLGSRSSKRLP